MAGLSDMEMGNKGDFGISPAAMNALNSEKDMEALKQSGGVEGLANQLHSNTHTGLEAAVVEASAHTFGANKYREAPAKSFFSIAWETMQDPIIILLMAAATLSTILGSAIPEQRKHAEWIEGVAIWVAVIVVICVGAGNDWQKDRQFRKLNAQKDAIQVKVVRGREQVLVPNTQVVVGDVLLIDTGDKVIADGIVVESFGLVIDEAALTGEGEAIQKDRDVDPWVRSGTQVTDGSGRILVTAVGPNSEWGKIMEMVSEEEDQQTPLQEKLEVVATAIGKVGFGVAIACFIALLIKWCVVNNGFPIKQINNNGPIQFFLYAVTIIVVAVPEGLPLAVTISLAYSMGKMMKDNNFVRVLSACETMGGATAICSDKTGTLTENRMTVVEGWFCGKHHAQVPGKEELPADVVTQLTANMAMNSKAFLIEEAGSTKIDFVGNRTECALLMMLKRWDSDYKTVREQLGDALFKLFGFSSERKMSCCVLREPAGAGYRVHNKGAAEWVLKRCNRQYMQDGSIAPLTDAGKEALLGEVTAMASRGLRCIALTTSLLPLQDASRAPAFFDDADNIDVNMALLAIVGIKDPVRQEVPAAVATCQRAGITVRMVTGDNIYTARHIARECGILPPDSPYTSIEGPDFRRLSEEERQAMLPMMRVLARSSPEDKRILVKSLRAMGEVVAVTGDGTNDAAALKASDVGLAMGIAGTEVAKEAADIVILDDNFSSIVKSVLWGRSVFTNIRKFLQFQVTVNFVALVTAFVGAVIGGQEPLNVLQLLWVNMIMDSMGALALATEAPTDSLLLLKPHGRDEPLFTPRMWKHIFVQGLYQLFWMFVCLYALPSVLSARYGMPTEVEVYRADCTSELSSLGAANATRYCNIMQHCGFPLGSEDRNTTACPLYAEYWAASPYRGVPDDQRWAACRVPAGNSSALGYECADNSNLSWGKDQMDVRYNDVWTEDRKRSLSVLFNAFIMMQVANEVNARRINDEYSIFTGFLQGPIFVSVIIITIGLQAIIINLLGTFFKTTPLSWQEWLATMAIGLGSIPISFITRFISNVFDVHGDRRAPSQPAAAAAAAAPQAIKVAQ